MPNSNERPSFDQIKQYNSIVDYFTQRLGAPYKVVRDEHFWPCPQHGGMSFSVNDAEGYKCFGCDIGGNLVDAFLMLEGGTVADAMETFARNVPGYHGDGRDMPKRKPLRRPAPPKPAEPHKPLSLDIVKANSSHLPEALPYFNHRCITTPTAYNKLLGKKTEFATCYEFPDGEKVWFKSPRFAIPNIFGVGTDNPQVRAINYRRDDEWCKEHLYSAVESSVLVRIMEDYRRRHKNHSNPDKRWDRYPTEEELIEDIYGAKYRQEAGSNRGAIFNADLIARREEKQIVYRKWKFIILVAEGKELDTLAIMDAGWPALGVPINADLYKTLPAILANIDMIYIAGANDPIGRKQSLDLALAVGRGNVLTPEKYKDANEVIMAGAADQWLTGTHNIPPVLRGAS